MAVHMYRRVRVNEVNGHEWLSARMFQRRVLNVRIYSELEVVQNGIYIVPFLAEHQVVETDITMKNLRDVI